MNVDYEAGIKVANIAKVREEVRSDAEEEEKTGEDITIAEEQEEI